MTMAQPANCSTHRTSPAKQSEHLPRRFVYEAPQLASQETEAQAKRPGPANKEGLYAWRHRGPNSERNLYGSPQPLACEIARGGKGRRICGPDSHLKSVPAGRIWMSDSSFIWTAIVPPQAEGVALSALFALSVKTIGRKADNAKPQITQISLIKKERRVFCVI